MARKNFRARVNQVLGVLFMVSTVIFGACTDAYEKSDASPASGKITTISFEPNSEKDGGNIIFTVTDGVTPKSARIAVSSSVTADNDYEISAAQKAVSFTAAGDITVDGTTATRRFNGSDEHPVSTTAMQDKLAVEIDGEVGTVTFTGVTMTNVKVSDNTSLQPLDGQRERMSTPVAAVWTGKATFTGKEKSFELNPATAAIRWISQDAPEVVDSIIDWTGNRSGYEALAQRDSAWVQIVYILSDGSRLDGMRYAKSAPRTLWGSANKMYVSAFEQNIGANFSGQSVVEAEMKNNELSDENWTISYETVQRNWNHEQVDVDGNKAVTSLFSKLPHFVFQCGKLSADFGRLPLNVVNTDVKVVDKSPVVEDGKSYEVKQIKNTISTSYGVDSTGIVAQQVISTVDLLKLNADVTLIDVTAVMSRSWTATQGTFTWKLTEKYSDGSTKDTTIVWSSARSIEANHFDTEDVKKALSEGAVTTEVAHSSVKTVSNPNYTIRYKVATATYSWINSFVKESATSIVTSSLPENVSLEYKGYKFNQPADEISYTKEQGSLIDSYDDGSKKIYDYKCNFVESVKGYDNSAAKAIATGTLTVNAAVPTSWELLSKTNEYFMFNHTVGAKYRVNYSDGSHQEFAFNNIINGESASTPVETTEDEVSERVGAPADYILNKENKKVNEYLSYAQWTTKVTENAERTRGEHQYGFTYSIGREVKYVRDFGNGVVVEINFEDPTISHNTALTDFVQTGEEETADATKYTWQRQNNLIVNINGANNTINNKGIIYIYGGHGGGEPDPEAPKAVIGGGIVSPKPGLSDSMWYVGYLLKLNNGKVRPLIVDKNGQNVQLGEEFDENTAWNGSAYINGTLYPVLGSNTGSMLKYTYQAGISYAISAVNAGDGFNWNHATVENVTHHYMPVIKQEGGKTILTLSGVANWSMSW